ncbi:23S rRNA (cytidine(2498)-2'-O)-methyltransferase RlmM [Parashewanella spongiae]|uniref:Ribosomal RNA large subunit methyltransferase M n=1 Tax=Parashewanella spongiae TaxID=342950 RepID=A0A3A6U6P1_9GAMM|nr:23S rRNA (cytidine(2498)-2'-O)-methyltransferase RlmM [Parashewanella spongiae]MCL1077904.1 23S rRNA (cytidine(2498)-2'-O)-methyltransferase RlmM [Parashewanella spongiae]RJY17549.1 23S rRNA (cytidine(2498)-2'-O)-methyltransferase RlmM [Parashewanella spongiae]
MNNLILYCRSGYEKDCAAEIQQRAQEVDVAGFVKTNRDDAYVVYQTFEENGAEVLLEKLPLTSLIFARQMFAAGELLSGLPEGDRVTPIVAALSDVQRAGEIRVETPDTNKAKELSGFCRKLTVPLRQGLRKAGILLAKENPKRPIIHVCFVAPGKAYAGYSLSYNTSPHFMGIPRLKFPSDAPSRSTLKLDEAFGQFLTSQEQEERLCSGMNSVDLGACPGGWTYQLVKRGMFVAAVDNGPMEQKLMDTGQVKHYRADGFKFEPPRKNIYWLVCDMVEKPSRVAELMEYWAIQGWYREAIFNLKLPMKSRYKEVSQILSTMSEILKENQVKDFKIQCKHLYHDRDEVTVHLWLNPNQGI